MTGVYPSIKKDKTVYYRSSITFRGKHISLGSYVEEQSASQAYQTALFLLEHPEYELEDYLHEAEENVSSLSLEKAVSLFNFRDNNIYFANPIYIRPKMFYYYLSLDEILKFDADDLFYFSSHKIQKRGGHLFVADFGMQINLSSRYGIKNHAIAGKDYEFLNGDPYDYRSINLKIINRYQGVSQKMHKGKKCYQSVIHVNGNMVIGYYNTENEAAIAYNKAADILKSHGCKKTYAPNSIEGIGPKEYAQLYSSIKISAKICNLGFHN